MKRKDAGSARPMVATRRRDRAVDKIPPIGTALYNRKSSAEPFVNPGEFA